MLSIPESTLRFHGRKASLFTPNPPGLIPLAPQHNSPASIRPVPLVLPQNAEERLSFLLFYLSYFPLIFTSLGHCPSPLWVCCVNVTKSIGE
jgi:hypothetical protein